MHHERINEYCQTTLALSFLSWRLFEAHNTVFVPPLFTPSSPLFTRVYGARRYLEYSQCAREYLLAGWPIFIEENLSLSSLLLLPRFLLDSLSALCRWPLFSLAAVTVWYLKYEPRFLLTSSLSLSGM